MLCARQVTQPDGPEDARIVLRGSRVSSLCQDLVNFNLRLQDCLVQRLFRGEVLVDRRLATIRGAGDLPRRRPVEPLLREALKRCLNDPTAPFVGPKLDLQSVPPDKLVITHL